MKKYLVFAILSFWLMFHTFSYANGHFLIGSKVWSDFGTAIPLIRSFSQGANWPPQHPLYPGEPIRYHYLFYLFVGLLERLGVRIDIAFNILSGLGFFGLLSLIYLLAKKLFSKESIAILSVIFFLFNSSLNFVDFFSEHGFNVRSLAQIPHQIHFASFAPWKKSEVAAFWNLNIYTNQRHLALSFAAVLLIILILISERKKAYLLVGPILAILLSLNQAAFLIALVYVFFLSLARPSVWVHLLLSAFFAIPFLYPQFFMSHDLSHISPHVGFLARESLSKFWFYNLGLASIFMPLGFLLSPKKHRPLILGTISVFIIANTFQLSPDIINNHKLINFAVIVGNIFMASFLIKLRPLIRYSLFIILILGGVMDLFPVINDRKISLADKPASTDIQFFASLPKDSLVLNSLWFYHPASLAGLPVFNGYSYFTWSYGYDQSTRETVTKLIYSATTKQTACKLLLANKITHVELNSRPEGFLTPNYSLWENNFVKLYSNPESSMSVYSVAKSCQV